MSVEEDVELRELVAQTLDSNGCLAKIKAQLRASMFLALDEDVKISKQEPLLNKEVTKYLETSEGQAMFCIVREFLEFFNLKCTITVYEPESYGENRYKYEGREKIIQELGLTNPVESEENGTVPVLWQLMKIAQLKTKSTIEINLNVNNNNRTHPAEEGESVNETISHNNTITNSNHNKTESNNNSIATEEESNGSLETSAAETPIVKNVEETMNEQNANETFIVTEQRENEQNDATNNKSDYKDDTYDDTSSIAEEDGMMSVNNLERNERSNQETEDTISKSHIDNEMLDFSPPIVKDKSKSECSDKSKVSPKQEKVKKSPLADLPPLPITKGHVNDILPSLYSKELKEKSNLRELNKLFEIEQEYEEDFMSSSSIDLSLQSTNHSSKNGNSSDSIPKNGEIEEL